MKITPEVRAMAMDWAGRRCECTGDGCRHHLKGARCKRGLRGDDWKVYWRSEDGGASRENVQAWCLECFGNNFDVPREMVALFTADIASFARLKEADYRRAITLKSVLRDVAERAATRVRGRMVLDRLDDDVLLEFSTTREAVDAARTIHADFMEMVERLDLPATPMCGAIHCGEVSRWRNGMLVGEAVDIAMSARGAANPGQVVVTEPAAKPMAGTVDLRHEETEADDPDAQPIWVLEL